jgi:nucleoside-diphosphate-sugar epimerase
LKITVTGAAGYIGSVLCPMLIAEGHEVTALDWFAHQNTLAPLVSSPWFDCYRVDCRDIAAVRPHLKKAEVVIPLAALVGQPVCDLNPVDAEKLNVTATLELFDACSHDQLICMPTTESVYGSNATLCTEETPCNPLSSYGRQKRAVELALMARGNAISLRLATVFGMSPRMRLDLLVNDFTWRALKDRALVVFEGGARRTYVHVSDVARAFVHALDLLEPGNIYNVGSVTTTKLGLCAAIKTQLPEFFYVEAAYGTDPDARDYVVSQEKIEATGYRSVVSLGDGIAELLKGYRMIRNTVHGNV